MGRRVYREEEGVRVCGEEGVWGRRGMGGLGNHTCRV